MNHASKGIFQIAEVAGTSRDSKKNVGPPFPYTFPIPCLGFMGTYIREAYENGSLTVGWGITRSRIPLFSILHL